MLVSMKQSDVIVYLVPRYSHVLFNLDGGIKGDGQGTKGSFAARLPSPGQEKFEKVPDFAVSRGGQGRQINRFIWGLHCLTP